MGCADQNPLQQSHVTKVSRRSRSNQACQQGADAPGLTHALELDSRDVRQRFWQARHFGQHH